MMFPGCGFENYDITKSKMIAHLAIMKLDQRFDKWSQFPLWEI
jgi:hypothetical protein